MSYKTNTFSISRLDYDAFIFDLDGVVTRTAKVHAAAWKELFDAYLAHRAEREGRGFQPFDIDTDYLRYVDGKPRYEGVRSFLKSRGITLSYGSPEDEPEKETVCGLGNRKNQLFHALLQRQGVEVYRSTVELIRQLRSKGFKTAIVSSSKNCSAVLEAAHIGDLFDTQVDGVDAERLGLKGKPAPDIFLEAANRLDVDPQRSVVAEDAIAGVKAGSCGKFGLVIGVDRGEQEQALRNSGADVTVADLAEITVPGDTPAPERSARDLPSASGSIEEISRCASDKRIAMFLDYDGTLTPIVESPDQAVLSDSMRESIRELARHCTVAVVSGRDLRDVRGLVGIEEIFYAGSHGYEIAGPKGRHVEYQQSTEVLPTLDRAEQILHNLVDWISGALIERKRFSIAVHYRKVKDSEIHRVEEAVDGVLSQYEGLRKSEGKKVFELQPDIEWDKGRAVTWLLQTLGMSHAEVLPIYIGDDTTDEDAFRALQGRGIGIIVGGGSRPTAALEMTITPENWSGKLTIRSALDGRVINAGVKRYRDLNSKHLEPLEAEGIGEDIIFLKVQTNHSEVRIAQTARTRVLLDGEARQSVERRVLKETGYIAQELKLALSAGKKVTIEKVMALFTSRDHAISECGVEARKAIAQEEHFNELFESHAMAWKHLWRRFDMELQTASEESQVVHLNPKSGRWIPDNSRLQRHVNAAIAYNIWQYYQVTGDMEFLSSYGAEMLLEIARFWSSIATYNQDLARYEILGVMGPDEYHESYPGSEKPGVNNNAYTNIMAVWVLTEALALMDILPEDRRTELFETLGLRDGEIARWEDVSRKMFVPFHGDGIISQFEGYDRLEEFDWEGYRKRYDDIQRLDRILEAEDDSPNRYKASKQADVLMLFYLFSSEELSRLFEQLGYPFEYETIPKNIDYYLKRTSHGSTLSRVAHSWVLARSDRARSWNLFKEALESDVSDIQGGTTPEGIHLGAMAGVVDLIHRAFTGIETREDVLWFNPCLPVHSV